MSPCVQVVQLKGLLCVSVQGWAMPKHAASMMHSNVPLIVFECSHCAWWPLHARSCCGVQGAVRVPFKLLTELPTLGLVSFKFARSETACTLHSWHCHAVSSLPVQELLPLDGLPH